MKKLTENISEHQVLYFFAITFLLSWPVLFVVFWLFPQNMAVQGLLGPIAVFSPAFSAIIVGVISSRRKSVNNRTGLWLVGIISWIFSWVVMLLFACRLRNAPLNVPMIAFSAIIAIFPAFVFSRAFSVKFEVRRYFKSLIKPKGNIIWYLIALFTVPLIQLGGYGITRWFFQNPSSPSELSISVDPMVAVILFLYGFLFSGGINEESGWRGFALPKLQEKFCPLLAAMIVWFFWALWHLPVDLSSGDPISSILINRLLFNAIWAILFMWVFNRTKGSLLAPALFHPAMNTSGSLLPRTDAATVIFIVLTLTVIWTDKMWRKKTI